MLTSHAHAAHATHAAHACWPVLHDVLDRAHARIHSRARASHCDLARVHGLVDLHAGAELLLQALDSLAALANHTPHHGLGAVQAASGAHAILRVAEAAANTSGQTRAKVSGQKVWDPDPGVRSLVTHRMSDCVHGLLPR